MEYIKKEELIEGEIYKANNESLTFIIKATKDLNNVINIPSYNEFMKSGNFNGSYLTFTNATPEEKHWLNTCIEKNRFIEFDEAMKTFIPEYVELLDTGCRINCNVSSGKIYKCFKDTRKTYHFGFLLDNIHKIGFNKDEFNQFLKSSTKEAYDAQFIVKEPEFVLPEKWCVLRNLNNYSIINNWFIKNQINHWIIANDKGYLHSGILKGSWINSNGDKQEDYTEITFEQFKKYVLKEEVIEEKVIEPLPQFKVIETIETITKVENNEGNQFFIGDTITPIEGFNKGSKFIISGFRYNNAKTNICAITDTHSPNGIGIDKIEHYIEPKVVEPEFTLPENWHIIITVENIDTVKKWWNSKNYGGRVWSIGACYGIDNKDCISKSEKRQLPFNNKEITFDQFKKYVLKEEVKEETLLEKAKRLYPIGTKFNNYKLVKGGNWTVEVLTNNIIKEAGKIKLINPEFPINNNRGSWTLYENGEWAEIINN